MGRGDFPRGPTSSTCSEISQRTSWSSSTRRPEIDNRGADRPNMRSLNGAAGSVSPADEKPFGRRPRDRYYPEHRRQSAASHRCMNGPCPVVVAGRGGSVMSITLDKRGEDFI